MCMGTLVYGLNRAILPADLQKDIGVNHIVCRAPSRVCTNIGSSAKVVGNMRRIPRRDGVATGTAVPAYVKFSSERKRHIIYADFVPAIVTVDVINRDILQFRCGAYGHPVIKRIISVTGCVSPGLVKDIGVVNIDEIRIADAIVGVNNIPIIAVFHIEGFDLSYNCRPDC